MGQQYHNMMVGNLSQFLKAELHYNVKPTHLQVMSKQRMLNEEKQNVMRKFESLKQSKAASETDLFLGGDSSDESSPCASELNGGPPSVSSIELKEILLRKWNRDMSYQIPEKLDAITLDLDDCVPMSISINRQKKKKLFDDQINTRMCDELKQDVKHMYTYICDIDMEERKLPKASLLSSPPEKTIKKICDISLDRLTAEIKKSSRKGVGITPKRLSFCRPSKKPQIKKEPAEEDDDEEKLAGRFISKKVEEILKHV